MERVYSTEALISILASEHQACLQGERLHLTAGSPSGHPVIDQFFQTEGLQKYSAYQGFKAAVHRYQREYGVSGLIWPRLEIQGKTITYPEVHPQLLALPGDLDCLRSHLPQLLQQWRELSCKLELHLAVDRGKAFVPAQPTDVETILPRTHWATLRAWERGDFFEMVLQLGWGQPSDAAHWRAWPQSGSEYIHAVRPGQRPIC
jgi:hypothetical protein